jgi:hypothetical protein
VLARQIHEADRAGILRPAADRRPVACWCRESVPRSDAEAVTVLFVAVAFGVAIGQEYYVSAFVLGTRHAARVIFIGSGGHSSVHD